MFLSEITPEGVFMFYEHGHVSFSHLEGNEKSKQAADDLKRRFEEGQKIQIQGVEFQMTSKGLQITDKKDVFKNTWEKWDRAFNEWYDLEKYNKEGFDRLMALDENSISKEELEKIYNEELAIARQNKEAYEENRKNQKTSFWRKLFGH